MTAAELTARLGHVEDQQRDNWGWNWNAVKRVLEHLFEEGLVSASSRTESFERRYTLTARVLPGDRAQERRHPNRMRPRHGPADRRRGPGPRDRDRAMLRRLLPDPAEGAAVAVGHLVAPAGCSRSRLRLGPAPIPSRRGETSARRHRPGPAESPSTPWCLNAGGSRSCSDSTTGSRSTPPSRSAVRLLRPAVPAAGRDRRTGRPQGRPGRRRLLVRAAHAEPGAPRGHRRRTRRRTAAHGRVAGTGRGRCLPGGGPCAGARRSRGCPVAARIRSEGTGATGPASLP